MYCLVKILHPVGRDNEYLVDATSLFDAVRRALEINEGFVGRRPDDTIVTVIEDGKQSIYWDYAEHNATKRKWRVEGGAREERHAGPLGSRGYDD